VVGVGGVVGGLAGVGVGDGMRRRGGEAAAGSGVSRRAGPVMQGLVVASVGGGEGRGGGFSSCHPVLD